MDDVHRLRSYVYWVGLVSWCLVLAVGCGAQTLTVACHALEATMVAFFVIVGVYGLYCGTATAVHLEILHHAAVASAYLSILSFFLTMVTSPCLCLPQSFGRWGYWWKYRLSLPDLNFPWTLLSSTELFCQDLMAACQTRSTLAVTMLFPLLLLLRGIETQQRWPLSLSIMLGSTYGFVVGSALGSLLVLGLHYSHRLRGWYRVWTNNGEYVFYDEHSFW